VNFGRVLASVFAVCFVACCAHVEADSLPQEAYVWQRSWNDSVVKAVTNHGGAFSNLVVLRAEVVWRNTKPEVIPVRLDYPALAAARRPVGIALRIGG